MRILERRRARQGLALPIVLLATALLTIALAVTFTMVGTERRVTNNFKGQLLAYSLAQTGLERCTANRVACGFATGDPAGAYDSTRIALTNGYADVVFERLRDTIGGIVGIYAVRSRGVLTARGVHADPLAERMVAQLAYFNPRKFRLLAAFTALNGLSTVTADSVRVHGAAPGTCIRPGVFSVAVPTSPGYTGPSSPTDLPESLRGLGLTASAVDSVRVDWDGIVNRGAVDPDVTVPPATMPTNGWKRIMAPGDLTVSGSGNGLLMVGGNLTISGNWQWDGLVLVGGTVTSTSGDQTINGAIISGLNLKRGIPVPLASDLGMGGKNIRYDPCMIDSALVNVGSFGLYRNVWMDAWKSY